MIILTFAPQNGFFVIQSAGKPNMYPVRIISVSYSSDLLRTQSVESPLVELIKNPKYPFMNITASYIRRKLQGYYATQEAGNLSRLICCEILGQQAVDYYLGKDITLSANEQCDLESIVERLKKNEPIQYIQGETCFYGSMFRVAPGVLIPRPETEELVDLIVKEAATGTRLLDIGTGSGCIAISLAKHIPQAVVTAWDVSEEALAIAGENNRELKAGVHFEKIDVLSAEPVGDDQYDMIVSNPPYVTESEKNEMEPNVLDWEPGLALFVPDNDPLRFYRRIASLGRKMLRLHGRLYFEINRAYGEEVIQMLHEQGYEELRLIKDISGNDRIVTAKR